MISSFLYSNSMMRFFVLFIFLFCNVYAISVKIVATVNDVAITSYDVNTRLELSILLRPDVFKNVSKQEVQSFVLESLIKEALFIRKSGEYGFSISDAELEEEIKGIGANISYFKGRNPKTVLSEGLYNSLKNQVLSEIITSSLIQSKLRGNVDFTEAEIERVQKSYKESENKSITQNEAKNILFSIRSQEAEQSLMSGITEDAVIERK